MIVSAWNTELEREPRGRGWSVRVEKSSVSWHKKAQIAKKLTKSFQRDVSLVDDLDATLLRKVIELSWRGEGIDDLGAPIMAEKSVLAR